MRLQAVTRGATASEPINILRFQNGLVWSGSLWCSTRHIAFVTGPSVLLHQPLLAVRIRVCGAHNLFHSRRQQTRPATEWKEGETLSKALRHSWTHHITLLFNLNMMHVANPRRRRKPSSNAVRVRAAYTFRIVWELPTRIIQNRWCGDRYDVENLMLGGEGAVDSENPVNSVPFTIYKRLCMRADTEMKTQSPPRIQPKKSKATGIPTNIWWRKQ